MTEKFGNSGLSKRRGGGWRSLGAAGAGIARKALGSKGRAFAAFLTDWPSIVGEETARHCLPVSLRFPDREIRRDAVLTLRVESGAWAAELSHSQDVVLERINGYFGYGAVAKLRLQTGPLPGQRSKSEGRGNPDPWEKAKASRPLTPVEEQKLQALLSEVENPELRASLERLGRQLLARR
ncbi:DUF721 domain-containing protein [Limibacillus halophilus]|uniref:DUF721 domain-containing protein n=1 Tax=Limibacillus halophilus TaxID=1579333 RepID=A0A839SYD3_9PROT|nr:DUF721 domain-containing protein [Limibacillus halophilus]MBB3065953.1 hypothetical protein [Limibacillus halophilus]